MNLAKRAILIAVDASPQSLAALETAAKVASRLNVELRAVYVEDINLIRTAGLPFACAISSFGNAFALTPETMEGQLRRQADIARSAVQAAGTHCNIAWSFSVVRGAVYQEIARAASGADLVAVGRSGWSSATGRRLGSLTRALVRSGATSLLMAAEGGVHGPLAVFYDGSPASDRAVALAGALDEKGSPPIAIIVVGDSQGLLTKARERLQETKAKAAFHLQADPAKLFHRSWPPQTRTLVIPATLLSGDVEFEIILESNLSIFLVK